MREFPPSLRTLYLASNLLTKVPTTMTKLTSLRILELGANTITEIASLEPLTALEELWLGRNRIKKIEVPFLHLWLHVEYTASEASENPQSPRLDGLDSLEELYISFNKIEKIENLSALSSHLQVLDVAHNQLSSCSELHDLHALRELWMNNNKLSSFNDLSTLSSSLVTLQTIYAENNPFCDASYRRKMLLLFPNVAQIDALPTSKTAKPTATTNLSTE